MLGSLLPQRKPLYLVQFEELLRRVGQLAEDERRVEVDLAAEGGHHLQLNMKLYPKSNVKWSKSD